MGGRLTGKSALISGGASGLGDAQAIPYAREFASVLIGDLQHEKGSAVVDETKQGWNHMLAVNQTGVFWG